MLVLGATGVSGRIAVAMAARMAAGRVIAAGRNRAILDRLPAAAAGQLPVRCVRQAARIAETRQPECSALVARIDDCLPGPLSSRLLTADVKARAQIAA